MLHVVTTHIMPGLINADGGRWVYIVANVDGKSVEVRAPMCAEFFRRIVCDYAVPEMLSTEAAQEADRWSTFDAKIELERKKAVTSHQE